MPRRSTSSVKYASRAGASGHTRLPDFVIEMNRCLLHHFNDDGEEQPPIDSMTPTPLQLALIALQSEHCHFDFRAVNNMVLEDIWAKVTDTAKKIFLTESIEILGLTLSRYISPIDAWFRPTTIHSYG